MSASSVRLSWSGEGLVFTGVVEDGPEITLDSDGAAGPSPTQLLLLSLAGCMGVDVRMILEKCRVPLDSLEVVVEGDRAPSPPRRFKALRLVYRLEGPSEADEGKIERAVQLSKDKYCSVLHTLREDLSLDIRIERV
ncbi:MAG: OsmC family protein [Gemmatimonadota bacterium]|jgi:putative redox protein